LSTITEIKCDFCDDSVREAWVYEHPAFSIFVAHQLLDVKAGAMAACADCRPLFEEARLEELIARVDRKLKPSAAERPLLLHQWRAYYAQLMRQHTEARHWKLGDEREASPRFFDYECPRCGYVLRYDAESYQAKGYTLGICPKCGLTIAQVGRPGPEGGKA
jgi:hypothetical protein